MAFNSLLLLVVGIALSLTFISRSEAGEAGVCYGMDGNDLINPAETVRLLQKNRITMVRLYGADNTALKALANTNIKVSVLLRNEFIYNAAMNPSYALQWVQSNVKAFPNTLIDSIAVGNEVFRDANAQTLIPNLIQAMKNMHEALVNVGLDGTVKVSTPIAFDAIKPASFPPSTGVFRDDLASVMSHMINFLEQTSSYLMVNIYPYSAYTGAAGQISYMLGLSKDGVLDVYSNLMYFSLFDAMLDTVYYAIDNLDNSGLHSQNMLTRGGGRKPRLAVKVTETGFPHLHIGSLKNNSRHSGRKDSVNVATKENAQTYNSNMVSKAVSGTGTPHYPDEDISIYIFSLFNENLKPGPATEQNFGLFYPTGNPVYTIPDFTNPSPTPAPSSQSWCVANAAVGAARLQAALDYACGHGADCSAIQPGKPCYEPNTKLAHATYACNDYYQQKGRASGTCDFSGAAYVVYQQPAGTCNPSASWCVANAAVGDARLQAALDYACGHGADCSAIQSGAQCFNPDTKVAHASYAFNDYYQRNGRSDQSCEFGGCGSVVHQQPTIGNCVLPSKG